MAKKKDKHQHKTNAVRIVEAAGIPYEMHEYEAPEGFLDGVSVAKALGPVSYTHLTLPTIA